jgi:hypothetical protein
MRSINSPGLALLRWIFLIPLIEEFEQSLIAANLLPALRLALIGVALIALLIAMCFRL